MERKTMAKRRPVSMTGHRQKAVVSSRRKAPTRCPACGGSEFEEGTLALYNSISYLVFNSEKNKYVTLGNSLNARVCLKCGRLELFAPPKAFKKSDPAAKE